MPSDSRPFRTSRKRPDDSSRKPISAPSPDLRMSATKGAVIEGTSLPERITTRRKEPLVAERSYKNPALEVIERAYIMWVLQAEGGNKTRAAEVLGIDPSTLYRKLSRYDEQPEVKAVPTV